MNSFAQKPLIIAHRGASAHSPENTLAAFQTAIDAGADGIEFDVRLAKDGVPIVFHDATLKRLARDKRRVADLSSEELSGIDVGSWFNRAFPNRADEKFPTETIPTLENLFDFLRGYKAVIYVELKGNNSVIASLTKSVCAEIQKTDLFSQIIIKSFSLEAIKIAKEILPQIKTAALFEPKILTILRKKKLILDEAENFNADEISIHYSLATKNFVAQAREQNFPVTIWTADNPAWIKRALNYKINAIITNDPARLLGARCEILKNLL